MDSGTGNSNGTGTDAELETFRQQWLSDLRSKRGHDAHPSDTHAHTTSYPFTDPSSARTSQQPSSTATTVHPPPRVHHYDDFLQTRPYEDDAPKGGRTLTDADRSDSESEDDDRQLVSALDHYEEAMEKEAQGNMGDSLTLYRKAYRVRF
jgi:F-box protein 9